MNRVVTAQSQVFGVLASTNRKLPIDADRSQVRIQLLEVCERLAVLISPEPIQSTGSREGRSALGIDKDARRRRMGAIPEFGRQVRAVLYNNELDQRGGVEVEDQARCSETRSETEPTPSTRAEREER